MKIKITYLLIVVVSFYLASCSGSSSKDDAAKRFNSVANRAITQLINKNPNVDSLYKQRAELYLQLVRLKSIGRCTYGFANKFGEN